MQEVSAHYYDGYWQKPRSQDWIVALNPATEQVIGRVASATAEEVDAAVRAANRALPLWRNTPASERAAMLANVAGILERRRQSIAATICTEVGMPVKLSLLVQTDLPIQTFRITASLVANMEFAREEQNYRLLMESAGVIAAITPWNYPLHQIVSKIAPAMAAGCTVVVKPSEIAPLNASILASAMLEAGVPAGVFNILHGSGFKTGRMLVTHPLVRMISFTGSTQTGKTLARDAAEQVKRVSLELGGKSAAVVLNDGNLEAAVKATLQSCFLNSGQTCSAMTRLIVPRKKLSEAEEIAESVAKTFTMGNPFADSTRLGPLISRAQQSRVRNYVTEAERNGAKLVTGGAAPPTRLSEGFYFRPTVFTQVDPQSRLAQEEIFGPVLCIIAADNDDEAIQLANSTQYGLAAAVWSDNPASVWKAVAALEAGQVFVNGGRFNPLAPFGGVKLSGYGRELGRFGIDEFLVPKAVLS